MHNTPLISIITPAYNCISTIEDTYKTLLDQTYINWEWVITEDCSSDDTLKKLKEISEKDNRVIILSNETNSGAAISRNKSIFHSKGEFLAFIDADDQWSKDKLNTQLKCMVKDNIDFSFTAYEIITEDGVSTGNLVDSKQYEPLSYHDMLKKKATLGCSTVMLRVSAFENIEMPLIRTGQDYALWLKLLRTGVFAYPITLPLTKYRIMRNSISRNKFKKAKRQWKIYREIERLGFFQTIYCFCFYAWRAVFRQ
ncbi:glycosyltransferase [Vibrio alginolyticus]|uniref:glycosyltransferase family 2 protein n=1 Tax=Vibrio alginolyticus TaxID=663 RepID=UPI00215D2041|nr:glycosyltransferase family 2 protein [Vibrio alginolyticus]EKL9828085.1 glycosyltransferase family 2 protein [Vibrio alginolyticus]ELE6589749.1 glycosyltransferase family 2 protein [Vibrio alginolyticus]MCR9902118.1 glycosyltransferase [Vibrio alginolyticus]WAE56206.1 glycosyltransferase [Vibrio alginolyticus]